MVYFYFPRTQLPRTSDNVTDVKWIERFRQGPTVIEHVGIADASSDWKCEWISNVRMYLD